MARLFLAPGESYGIVSNFVVTDVIGTNDHENVTLTADATATFDPSFNRGGDTINIGGVAALYSASLVGSAIVLTADNGALITIPVGGVGATINFADASRVLVFDGTNVTLGDQTITSTPHDLTPGAPQNEVNFAVTTGTAAGADVMHLTGEGTVRVDLTKGSNQIIGVDLNGDGVIALNGQENNPAYFNELFGIQDVQATKFEIVDAYSRDHLNYYNSDENFLGNLLYDGTGLAGDGTHTNGNIVLGGLGADTIFGGIGNDFLVGGGVLPALPTSTGDPLTDSLNRLLDFLTKFSNAFDFYNAYESYNTGGIDALSGGRNADFFFADFSTLSLADGDALFIDAGTTADNTSATISENDEDHYQWFGAEDPGGRFSQDSDWFLVEASDDEEPIVIELREGDAGMIYSEDNVSTIFANIFDIENLDASGNLYGFVDDMDVALGEGGKSVNGENVGIGSSAQLVIDGSTAANIIVGGYDNDRIFGNDGDDLLFGGNLRYALNNPSAAGIVNDGMDQLYGGYGDDDIAFEADGGRIWGEQGDDTLWLTSQSLGTKTVDEVTTDGWLRFDLMAGGLETEPSEANLGQTFEAAGYGGADVSGTQDQTNYAGGGYRVDLESMENVDATGLGAVDYRAAGSNNPDLVFRNQQNHLEYLGNLDLRGTAGDNNLFGSDGGTDIIEGRAGDDVLGGGKLNDDFYFSIDGDTISDEPTGEDYASNEMYSPDDICGADGLQGFLGELDTESSTNCQYKGSGDGVDVIVGKADVDNDNLWDTVGTATYLAGKATWFEAYGSEHQNLPTILGTRYWDVNGDGIADYAARNVTRNGDISSAVLWKQDFGDTAAQGNESYLNIDFRETNFSDPEVIITSFSIKIGGEVFAVNSADLAGVDNVADIAQIVNARYNAQDENVHVTADLANNTVIVTDDLGREMSDTIGEGYLISFALSNSAAETYAEFTREADTIFQDRIIYKAYEDRSDNEGVDDDSITGSTISLGVDGYAEDLVVSFTSEGTHLAEDQFWNVLFGNLTTEDFVTMEVNGVKYCLEVGVALNGTQIDAEDGQSTTNQVSIQNAFLERYAAYINSFMDDDTSAGSLCATVLYKYQNVTLTMNEFRDPNTGNAVYDFNQDGQVNQLDTNLLNSYLNSGTLAAVGIQLSQHAYAGEETVYINQPTVTITNDSGGELPFWSVENVSESDVFLFGYDGRDGGLNADNVLFIGEEGVNRAVLLTAEDKGSTLQGLDSLVVDAHSNDLVDTFVGSFGQTVKISDNKAIDTKLRSDGNDNVSFHGDDLLITGKGNDVAMGGTGDDRIRGSIGNDKYDGGNDLYMVKLKNESTYHVQVLSAYEATVLQTINPNVTDVILIQQSENGLNTIGGTTLQPVVGGAYAYFSDTLIYQQSDLDEQLGHTGNVHANIKITLDTFTGVGEKIVFDKGGAGSVVVDQNGNGSYADESNKSTFTNFEHVRTVAGTGKAVAGDGQGNDTLDVSALSTAADVGVYYDLTDAPNAGSVSLLEDLDNDKNHIVDNIREVLRVDGVENVIFGEGSDLLKIDETEAAKNNSIIGGSGAPTDGYDIVQYYNNFAEEAGDTSLEPQLTFNVESKANTDTVVMTGGRLGDVVATDTLFSIEEVGLYALTARGLGNVDVLNTSSVAGATIDLGKGTVSNASGTLVTIDGIEQFENFTMGAGNDLLIVDDAYELCCNVNADDSLHDLTFNTYLNYDLTDAKCNRLSISQLLPQGKAPEVSNFELFTFNLDGGTDRVDYSRTTDALVALVSKISDPQYGNKNYVFVDAQSNLDDANPFNDECDRVDALVGVEQIVASQGESRLDFTANEDAHVITFQWSAAANKTVAAADRLETTIRIADGNNNVITGIPNYVEYWDLHPGTAPDFNNALWSGIEGNDSSEHVIYQTSLDLVNFPGVDHRYSDDVLNLRGGDNRVQYSDLVTSIETTFEITDSNGKDGVNTGIIEVNNRFYDGLGTNILKDSGEHYITSAVTDNCITPGSLTINATQDDFDTLIVNGDPDMIFTIGKSPGVIEVGRAPGSVDATFTGYEYLEDNTDTNDCYDLYNIKDTFANLDVVDPLTGDHDTLKVHNDVILDYGPVIDFLDLQVNVTGLTWADILDVSAVTGKFTGVNGDAAQEDIQLVLGKFGSIDVTNVDSVTVTDATVAATGPVFTINTNNGQLVTAAGAVTAQFDGDWEYSFSASGEVLDSGNSTVANLWNPCVDGWVNAVSSAITVNVVGNGDTFIAGGNGNDKITASGGNDHLYGGLGADVIDGGFTAAIGATYTLTLQGNLAGDDYLQITGPGGTLLVGSNTSGVEYQVGSAVADEDQIGTLLDGLTLAQIETELGYAAGSIANATYDTGSNKFVITFNADQNYAVPNATLITPGGADAGTTLNGSNASTAFVPSSVESDTYLYCSGAESTQAAMDTIIHFDVGATDDVLDFSQIFDFTNANTAVKDSDAGTANDVVNFAKLQFGNGYEIAVASDGTDSWVFADTNRSGTLDASDLAIKLAGVNQTALVNWDGNNILGDTSVNHFG